MLFQGASVFKKVLSNFMVSLELVDRSKLGVAVVLGFFRESAFTLNVRLGVSN